MNRFVLFSGGAVILLLSSAVAAGLSGIDAWILEGSRGHTPWVYCAGLVLIPSFLGAVGGMGAGGQARKGWVLWTSAVAGSFPGVLLLLWFLRSNDLAIQGPFWRTAASTKNILYALLLFIKPPVVAGTLSGLLFRKLLDRRNQRDRDP